MSKSPYYKTLSAPHTFVWRMLLFLILTGLIAAIMREQIVANFQANPPLNGLIIGVMALGVLFTFQQVLRLYPEVRWVNKFRLSDPGLTVDRAPVMLAPMATLFRRRQGQAALSPATMRSILDSIGSRLDESRETTRYLVGLLIFLGLLGTFWGLLKTTSSVGGVINALNTEGKEAGEIFKELKDGLASPLAGMGTAFSASLFGLAGSLILGFLDLQAGHAQSRFYNELEEWLSGITELQPEGQGLAGSQAQLRFALLDVQRSLTDLTEKIDQGLVSGGGQGGVSAETFNRLSDGINALVQQMRSEQKVLREWINDQAQNQTQLATVMQEQNRLASALREIAARAPRRSDPVDRG